MSVLTPTNLSFILQGLWLNHLYFIYFHYTLNAYRNSACRHAKWEKSCASFDFKYLY